MGPATPLADPARQTLAQLFAEFSRTRSSARKRSLVEAICRTIALHVQIDEEIVAPSLRRMQQGKATLARIRDHHANLRRLMAEVQGAEPDEEFDSTVDVIAAESLRLSTLREQHPGLVAAPARKVRELNERVAARRLELLDTSAGARGSGWD